MKKNTKQLICAILAILFVCLTVFAVGAEQWRVVNGASESVSMPEDASDEIVSEEASDENVSEDTSDINDNIVYKLGDVNMDNEITAADARLTLRQSALIENLSDEQIVLADVDRSGKITASDARQILRYAALLQETFIPVE